MPTPPTDFVDLNAHFTAIDIHHYLEEAGGVDAMNIRWKSLLHKILRENKAQHSPYRHEARLATRKTILYYYEFKSLATYFSIETRDFFPRRSLGVLRAFREVILCSFPHYMTMSTQVDAWIIQKLGEAIDDLIYERVTAV